MTHHAYVKCLYCKAVLYPEHVQSKCHLVCNWYWHVVCIHRSYPVRKQPDCASVFTPFPLVIRSPSWSCLWSCTSLAVAQLVAVHVAGVTLADVCALISRNDTSVTCLELQEQKTYHATYNTGCMAWMMMHGRSHSDSLYLLNLKVGHKLTACHRTFHAQMFVCCADCVNIFLRSFDQAWCILI